MSDKQTSTLLLSIKAILDIAYTPSSSGIDLTVANLQFLEHVNSATRDDCVTCLGLLCESLADPNTSGPLTMDKRGILAVMIDICIRSGDAPSSPAEKPLADLFTQAITILTDYEFVRDRRGNKAAARCPRGMGLPAGREAHLRVRHPANEAKCQLGRCPAEQRGPRGEGSCARSNGWRLCANSRRRAECTYLIDADIGEWRYDIWPLTNLSASTLCVAPEL